jgi:hypothetical protein
MGGTALSSIIINGKTKEWEGASSLQALCSQGWQEHLELEIDPN